MSSSDEVIGDVDQVEGRLLRRIDPENRYGLVLLLIGVTYGVSVANTGTGGALAVVFIQLLTIYLVFTVAGSKRARHVAEALMVLLAVLAVSGAILGSTRDDLDLAPAVYVTNAALYLVAPVAILRSLVRRRTVDLQTFLGAVASYLLIGMMFAFTYRALGSIQDTPFFGTGGDGDMSDDLFFSFITLTTTGYGNLVPAYDPGQTLAVVEAITGQLFLVIVIAKIVTSWGGGLGDHLKKIGPALKPCRSA